MLQQPVIPRLRSTSIHPAMLPLNLLLSTAAFSAGRAAQNSPPHIVFLVADDLGWNDVGFHGSKQVRTPHIDKIAAEGITLERYYVQQECSPSRASFLTGRHVAHTGIQAALVGAHNVDSAPVPLKPDAHDAGAGLGTAVLVPRRSRCVAAAVLLGSV